MPQFIAYLGFEGTCAEADTGPPWTQPARFYSASVAPEPPISFGISLNLGSPSFIRNLVSW